MDTHSNSTDPVKFMASGTTSPENASTALPTESVHMVITGQLVSMKNRKIQSVKRGRAYTFKNPAVVRYEQDFSRQVPARYRNLALGGLKAPLRATITVFYVDRRSDLDCALVYDCLQTSGVIANDRYVVERHEYLEVDPANPRCEITIEEI